jgi:periplasmic protein TonB
MRIITLTILLIFSVNTFSQQTIKIKKEKLYEGGTPYPKHKEIYYVLKSDHKIKHGSYKLRAGKRKLIEGWYDHNLKDSLWILRPTGMYNNYVRAKGYYKNGKKVGIWEYYNKKGLEQRFNYSSDSLLFSKVEIKDTMLSVKTDSGFMMTKVDSPPIFKEGETAKNYYLNSANFYFGYDLPKDKWIYATIQFEIDTNGFIHDYKIISGDYKEYNENALERVKKIPNEWIPAKINHKSVTTLWTITIESSYSMSKW